ncbi:metallophosphoesterase family protein [Halobacteriales archaeon Cl-PHB]
MARILHTADVHLDPDHPERTDALEAVLALATDEEVDCLTIGGDLFDSERAAETLRSDLRDLFADLPFPVRTIPGNHDAAAFGDDLFFGEAFEAAVAEPFGHHEMGETRLTTLPYRAGDPDEALLALAEREPHDGPEVLVLHCSLEAPVDSTVGDEGQTRYFPVDRHQLAELDLDYVLAGHFHSAHELALPGGGRFVYPGSPASVTSGEQGPRGAVLVDTGAGRLERCRLDTFHHDRLELTVTPGEEDAALERVASKTADWAERWVDAEIAVEGFVTRDEAAFHEGLQAASGDVPVDDDTRTVGWLESHPLYEAVEAELAARDLPTEAVEGEDYDPDAFEGDVRQALLSAFAALEAEGRLS